MFNFRIDIKDVQHIKKFTLDLDLSENKLTAIIGKNGAGKTLLFKAIQNLITSNTFNNTSNKHIFCEKSQIIYTINLKEEYIFDYNHSVETIDYKGEISHKIKKNISVELPIPFGERFRQFQRLGEIDQDIRKAIISQQFETPEELIDLLNYMYDTDRFNNLIEIKLKNKKYYAVVLLDNYYIREDYLSSGEYFIISIYKLIQSRCKFIAIDEIDISLDAMAQVRLIQQLRELAKKYEINLLFTTHSLGLMKTLRNDELFYMELSNSTCTLECKSYNYIKSILYGFVDYDKYILVEDEVLKEFIEYMLKEDNIFSKYIILPIGGADNVVKLMDKNKDKQIFSSANNVITILDGDKSDKNAYNTREDIIFLPFQDIEKDFYEYYKVGEFGKFSEKELKQYNLQIINAKNIYNMFIREKIKTKEEIFQFLATKKDTEVKGLKIKLTFFLSE